MLEAVIFDMDGVIVDSEPIHLKAAILTLKEYHVDVTLDYLNEFVGSTTYFMCQKMIKDFHIDASPEDLCELNEKINYYLLQKEGHIVVPYVIDLIKDLHCNGVKLAIASSSSIEAIHEVLSSLQITGFFDAIVSGMQVDHPKPSPDIFLEAARRLNADPDKCVVIEDSSHGITAAIAAGMTGIGYINPNSGNQNLSKAAILVEGFDEIDYNFIKHVYQYTHLEPITVLSTDRFIIKELSVDDIEDLYHIYQKPEVRKFLDDMKESQEVEKEKHEAYIKNVYHFYGYGLWGVYMKDTKRLIGRCGVETKKVDGEEVNELGYLLDPSYWGRGYAKEFVSEIINYCFTELNMHRIVAIIDIQNIKSIHLAEQIGMQLYGKCMRNHRDCYKYQITYHL